LRTPLPDVMPRRVSESDEDKNGNKAQENALPLHHGPPGVIVHLRAEVRDGNSE
jgi:hypothetical protein